MSYFDSWEQLQELVHNNLLGDYGRDCESRDTTVSFMTVFGVLFSGVSKMNRLNLTILVSVVEITIILFLGHWYNGWCKLIRRTQESCKSYSQRHTVRRVLHLFRLFHFVLADCLDVR